MQAHCLPCLHPCLLKAGQLSYRKRGLRFLAASASGPGATSAPPPLDIAATVSNVMQRHSSAPLAPSEVFKAIDAMGIGIATCITRTWSTALVTLKMEGVWQGRDEARRIAMLAVYQARAGAL